MSMEIEKSIQKNFYSNKQKLQKTVEWLLGIYEKELKILDLYVDGNLVYIKYELNNHKRGLYFPLGDVAVHVKENKRIFKKIKKNFLKDFCILF